MSLNNVLTEIQSTKWTKINNFEVMFGGISDELISSFGMSEEELNKMLPKSLISIDTPNLTNQPLEEFFGYRWNFTNTRDELYRITLTFRDFDQNKLYKGFLRMYRRAKNLYPKDVKFSVHLLNGQEYDDENMALISSYEDCIIESISQLQFNTTTENQVAEFSIGLKFSNISLPNESGDVAKFTY